MANSGTGHGRHGRLFVKVPGASAFAEIPKLGSSGSAVSQFEVAEPIQMNEDTGMGDTNITRVPGLPDWTATCRFFFQDASTEHIQYDLMKAARAGERVEVQWYPMQGAGVNNFYYQGDTFWAMTSLPGEVANLISANFEISAAESMLLVTPND